MEQFQQSCRWFVLDPFTLLVINLFYSGWTNSLNHRADQQKVQLKHEAYSLYTAILNAGGVDPLKAKLERELGEDRVAMLQRAAKATLHRHGLSQ